MTASYLKEICSTMLNGMKLMDCRPKLNQLLDLRTKLEAYNAKITKAIEDKKEGVISTCQD